MASSTEYSVSFNLSPSSSSSTSPCSFRSPPSTLHFSQSTNKTSLSLSSSHILSGFGHPHPLTVVCAKGYKMKTHKLEIRCRKKENSKNMYLDASGASENVSLLNCIDLSSPDIHSSVSLLKQACLDSGFFYVINHGISQEFMDEVFYQSKRFFDLPISEKMKLLRNEKHRGYTPVLDEYLDPAEQKHGDFKEGYYIGVEVPENDPDWHKPFYGPNVWPTADILPGWRETMEKYHREAFEVAKAIARIIALALDLEVDYFDQQETLGKPIATLRLLHYEGRISDPAEGIFGAGAHSDFGFITLLATDDNHGLQICKDKDAKPQQWEFVAPLRGAFIVNLADLLERWSNCIFRLHTLRIPIMIVLLNACPPASHKRTLQSFHQSSVKLTCSSDTRTLMRDTRIPMQVPTHTTNNTPKSVNHECWKFLFIALNRGSLLPATIHVETGSLSRILGGKKWFSLLNSGKTRVHTGLCVLSLSPMCNHMCRQVGALCLLREQIIWLCMCCVLSYRANIWCRAQISIFWRCVQRV